MASLAFLFKKTWVHPRGNIFLNLFPITILPFSVCIFNNHWRLPTKQFQFFWLPLAWSESGDQEPERQLLHGRCSICPLSALPQFAQARCVHQRGPPLHSLVNSYCIQDLYELKDNFLPSCCNVGGQPYNWRKNFLLPLCCTCMSSFQDDENESTDWTFWTCNCMANFILNHLKISLCDTVRQLRCFFWVQRDKREQCWASAISSQLQLDIVIFVLELGRKPVEMPDKPS